MLHALQHQTFIAASILVWVSVLEPARRRVPGELWKIPHIVGTRFAGMFLGMAFVILQRPIYEGFYGSGRWSTASRPRRTSSWPGG